MSLAQLPDNQLQQLSSALVTMADCTTREWPVEFQVWQLQITRRVLPILHRVCLREGLVDCNIPKEPVQRIILIVGWMVQYLPVNQLSARIGRAIGQQILVARMGKTILNDMCRK